MRTQTTTISSLSPEYQELKKLFPSLGKKPPVPDPLPSQPVDGPALLHDISGFIGRYLQCSDHQRTLLALWVFHTWCSAAAQVTPDLSIHSAYTQSGKTLCLQLLSLLCDNPALTAGFTTSKLALRMRLKPPSALLLDDCHAILGTGSRSKRPGLQAILAGGYHRGLGYSGAVEEYNLHLAGLDAHSSRSPLGH